MKPQVQPFFHADSNTWSYVVREPDGAAAAVIDAVLDFDAKAARTSTASAQQLVDFVDAQGLQVRWILETHAHADHFSAGHWLKSVWPQATAGDRRRHPPRAEDLPPDLQPRRPLSRRRLAVRSPVRRWRGVPALAACRPG